VAQAYIEVARQQETVKLARENLGISQNRLERVKARFDLGSGSRIDVLNAQVDLDADSTTLLDASVGYLNAKRNLSILMGRQPATDFAIHTSLPLNENLDFEQLKSDALQYNAQVEAAGYQVQTAVLDRKISKTAFSPQLDVNGSYNYIESTSDAGILLKNQSSGFTVGGTVSLVIFSGWQRKIQMQNAQLQLLNRQEELAQAKKRALGDITNTFAQYEKSLTDLQMAQRNLETATLNLERSTEAYRLGQLNNTQFREAQLNLARAKNRLINAHYAAKLTEVQLLQLSGQLLE